MLTEFHKKLKEKAPKLMDEFCKIYGYTYYDGHYYNNYLLDATRIKVGRNFPGKIERLKEKFDVNLEQFKLDVISVISHLQANGYCFDFFNSIFETSLKRAIQVNINIWRHNDDGRYKLGIPSNYEKQRYLEYAIQDACIIACEDLEKTLK